MHHHNNCVGDGNIKETETGPYLSVVVPAYNEEQRLPQTLHNIMTFLRTKTYSAEIIVVDDGSADNTAQAVEEFAASQPIVKLIRNEHRGKAYAVRTGVLAAHGEHVLFTDADGATPIEEVDKLLPYLEGEHDVAIASREGLGARRYNEPAYRHLMGRAFNLIVRSVAVRGIQDTQCGFKAFRRKAAKDLFRNMQLYGDGTGAVRGAVVTAFDVEILFLAQKWGYAIAEVPVQWHYGADSKVNPLKDSWRNLRDVLRVRWNDLCGRYRPA
ncbi:MAG: glycosyltransferase family 2 protein [Anaerolineales bacterium]|nr:MAG: glycosyltransferase family 2 protein [Anaerolineales bacterium]